MRFIDTCILIEHFNNKIEIKNKNNFCFNSIVHLEFLTGAQNKQELAKINNYIKNFCIVDIDQYILNIGVELMNKYSLSHNMQVCDSIIAASCMVYNLPLWTYNTKDFKFLNIELHY